MSTGNSSSSKSFLQLLRDRENGASPNPYRLTCKMLRSLFESPYRRYGRRVWQQPKQKYSTAPWFVEEASRLLVNSRQTCLTTLMPRKPLFDVDSFVSRSSIVLDVLFCQSPLESLECLRSDVGTLDENGFFIFLFKLGFMELRSPNTGRLMQRVFLSKSPLAKMHEMNWNVIQESFVVSSVCQPKRSSNSNRNQQVQTGGDINDVVISFMLFKVFPLKFFCHLQIRRSVFGSDVVSAEIHHDLLLIMHSGRSMVRIYSLQHLLDERCSEWRPLVMGERDAQTMLVVGTFPDGIPVNVDTKTAPPLLFEVSSHGHHLELAVAGVEAAKSSLLCLVSPLRAPFQFNVVDAMRHSTLKNGVFEDNDVSAVTPHRLFTHPDDSSRLLYITGSKVVVYKYNDKGGTKRLDIQFTLEVTTGGSEESSSNVSSPMSPPPPIVSSKGRQVKRCEFYGRPILSSELDDNDNEIHTVVSVSYSAELELLAVLVSTTKNPTDRVMFFDNFTGRLVKTVQLTAGTQNLSRDALLSVACNYEEEQYIGLTFDTIVHCRRETERHSSRWTCAIYNNVFTESLSS